MNIFSKKLIGGIAVTALVISINSCVKQKFDEPPTGGTDPVVEGTYKTIAEFKALYVANTFTPVSQNFYIVGIVTADDQSGNFYKEMVIQDTTGGISIILDQSNYYVDYPIGRRVFIKCQGLYMASYNGLIQLGASIDNTGSYPVLGRIPSSLVSKYILKGTYYHNVIPKTVTVDDLNADPLAFPQNTLVTIANVQFTPGDTSRTWADAAGLTDRSTSIEDCSHNSVIVRSSGYAEFAGQKVLTGNGSITGVMQIYYDDLQLKIRNLNDVKMSGSRCGEITDLCIFNDVPGYMTIDSVRKWKDAGNTFAPPNRVIKAVVTSDIASNNFTSSNLYVQDSTAAIVVRFTSPHNTPLGSLVTINISNQELSDYHGLLEVNNVAPSNLSTSGTCVAIPQTVTIADINANLDLLYESKLIRINNVVLSGSGTTWYDATTITDATGSMKIYTQSFATFSYDDYPAGNLNYIIGIVSDYDGPEFYIRNLSDVHP